MSWITKIFTMFQNNEDNEHTNDKNEHSVKPPQPVARKQSKEVEARVSYHYPKGNFRFPLIPDDEASRARESKPQPDQLKSAPEIDKKGRNLSRMKENSTLSGYKQPAVRQEASREQAPVKRNEHIKVSSSKFRQPFRPTEIPSPIYAFNRPPKKQKPAPEAPEIEYELSGFEAAMQTEVVPFQTDPVGVQIENDAAEAFKTFQPEESAELVESLPSDDSVEMVESFLSVDPVVIVEQVPSGDPAEIVEQVPTGESTEAEIVPASQAEEIRPAEMRPRQLPFNVVMLKQDKRKLEERKPGFGMVPPSIQGSRAIVPPAKEERRVPEPAAESNPVAVNPEPAVADDYEFPPLHLLNPPVFKEADSEWLAGQERLLNETLMNFNVGAKVVNMTQGPSVTRFEVQPEPGVKVNKITNLSDDIKLSLAAKDIRIEAPIPGKHTIGIEVPNQTSRPVLISEILQAGSFLNDESPLSVALGLDIAGNPIVTDLKKMPHGLIAGATGSGKSVCINTMLVSILYKAHPDDVKLLLIDPKMVELAPYNQIPHLVSPVITDVKAATASLKWAVEEMERRYELFAHAGVRDINRFNELAVKHRRFSEKLPFIVIVIDELADLMMMAPADVEEAICRIAQKARACGIHLVIATQRPSVDVITGLIKANVPTRIAFSVSSQIDSRTIIDISGAEKLLGRGDMLFLENGSSKPFRLQGTFVTDNEIDDVVAFVREQKAPVYLFEQEELLRKAQITEDEDELFLEACEFVIEQGGASTSSVQRRFKIGYNRAARLIEMMEQQGYISGGKGSRPRDVLISAADLESINEASATN